MTTIKLQRHDDEEMELDAETLYKLAVDFGALPTTAAKFVEAVLQAEEQGLTLPEKSV